MQFCGKDDLRNAEGTVLLEDGEKVVRDQRDSQYPLKRPCGWRVGRYVRICKRCAVKHGFIW